ncbi:MAG: hypothetical protein ACHQ0J_14560 [Candidatus Dormibacterales bacterium]
MRWLSISVGVVLIAVAFAAATRVADTREGLIAEVVTLFAALVGISFVLFGMFAGVRLRPRSAQSPPAKGPAGGARSVRDLLLGGAGVAVTLVLLAGLTASAGIQWAGLGSLMLLPLIAGSLYLCIRFLRAPVRDWRVSTQKSQRPKQP